MTDTQTEKSVVNHLMKKLGGIIGCYAIKTHGGGYGSVGQPDIIGCYSGCMFAVEVKTSHGKISEIQKSVLNKWNRAGAVTAVVWSTADADHFVKYLPIACDTDPTSSSGVLEFKDGAVRSLPMGP